MGTTGDAAGIWANPVVHRFSAANPMADGLLQADCDDLLGYGPKEASYVYLANHE